MKTLNISFLLLILLSFFTITSCTEEAADQLQDNNNNKVEVPTNFKVELPTSISSIQITKNQNKSETINGNELYNHLNTFIFVGESAADIVNNIMQAIATINSAGLTNLTFVSPDDNRSKTIAITTDQQFENKTWEYKLVLTDDKTQEEQSDGIAMQVFWNNQPIDGIAILRPKYFDFNATDVNDQTMIRIDYSETQQTDYTQSMIVSIANWPMPDPTIEPYALNNMKMFVGKNGDLINIYGNSNHPNANFYTTEAGFQWAFTATADEAKNIAVAEVGLPRSTETGTTRQVLITDNSIFNVFYAQIQELYPNATSEQIDTYLQNTQAPAFFSATGFIQAQTSPGDDYTTLITSQQQLTPYQPTTIAQMQIQFQ